MSKKPYQSMFVNANGIKTHFVVAGEGEPLVLVHGGGPGSGGEAGWSRNIPALAEHFRVYALDRIGYGLTDKPAMEYTDLALANHLADFVDALCLDKVHMMGNSMGAYGVARYAVDHPERMKKMVLVASGSIASSFGLNHRLSKGQEAMKKCNEEPTRENMRAVLEGLVKHTENITDELVDNRLAVATSPGAQDAQRSHAKYRARMKNDPNLMQQYSLKYRLPELTIPTMMIWGKLDTFAPLEDLGYPLRDMLPNLKSFHVFEDSAHQVQNDEVEKFNQVVPEFFRN